MLIPLLAVWHEGFRVYILVQVIGLLLKSSRKSLKHDSSQDLSPSLGPEYSTPPTEISRASGLTVALIMWDVRKNLDRFHTLTAKQCY